MRARLGRTSVVDLLVVAGTALLCGALLAAYVDEEYFYADDWVNLMDARNRGITWELLKSSYFGSFAPGHRVLDYIVMRWTDASWTVAVAMLLAFYVAAVFAFYALIRDLVTNRWWILGATAFFAAAVPFIRTIQWFASGAHTVPATFFTLVAMWAAVRWARTRQWWLLPVSLVAHFAALAFYTKPLLTAGYLVLLWALVLKRETPVRAWPRAALRDWPLWLAVFIPPVVYTIYTRSADGRYYLPSEKASFGEWVEFFPVTWARGIAPLAIGQNNLDPIEYRTIVLSQIACVLVIALSFWLRRGAWRGWVFLLLAAIPNIVMLGIGRMPIYGTGIGADLRYEVEFGFLLPIAAAIAFSGPPREGARLPRLSPRAAAIVAGVGVLAFLGSYVRSLHRYEETWPSDAGRVQAEGIRRDVDRQRAQGRNPVAIDGPMNLAITDVFNRASTAMPEIAPDLPVNRTGGDLNVITNEGLRPVTTTDVADIRPGRPGAPVELPPGAKRRGDSLCLPVSPDPLSIVVNGPITTPEPEPGKPPQPVILAIATEQPVPPALFTVFVDQGQGVPPPQFPDRAMDFRGAKSAMTDIPGHSIKQLKIDVPPFRGVCVERILLSQAFPQP